MSSQRYAASASFKKLFDEAWEKASKEHPNYRSPCCGYPTRMIMRGEHDVSREKVSDAIFTRMDWDSSRKPRIIAFYPTFSCTNKECYKTDFHFLPKYLQPPEEE